MRYSRQEAFREIGKEGQDMLKTKTAAIVGCGALGSCSAELLARAGIGKLRIIDKDKVEDSNLPRVSLFSEKHIGIFKAEAARQILQEINGEIEIEAHCEELCKDNLSLLDTDIVLDCTDNLETRFLVNEACAKKKPWVFSAVQGSSGFVMAFTQESKIGFESIFKNLKALETTKTAGILNSTARIASALQATEAIKILLEKKPCDCLIHFDVWNNTLEKINIKNY